ncbi:TPA: MgtC/SapB family protein [Candidatus Woesearchaeota archaeon]|nr:MgtC/SapB family protein [Candidatus Woesearchaeota archaeon]
MDIATILLRLGITFAFTVLFGLERQRAHKPVGFGTFTFAAVGSCALAITAVDLVPGNPVGLMAAVVTCIGFLGAGALIRSGDRIFGFTTSASMWLFAIIGILLGVGEYLLGTLVYSMVWGVIYTDAYLERHSIGSYHRKLIITASMKAAQKDIESLLVLFTQKHKLISTEVDKKNNRLSLTYLIEGRREAINAGLKKFYDKEWFEGLKVE